jgi:aspartate aminotransferase
MATFPLASRVTALRQSPSVAAAQRVRELEADGRAILDLTVGEPDFDTPEHIVYAAIEAMHAGATRYTPVNGVPELRAAITATMKAKTGLDYESDRITIGGGAKQVIFLALMATVEEGVEVIVPAPYWVSYPDMVAAHGGTPVVVQCPESENFLLTPERFESAITPATRWVILNTPSNPTGAIYNESQLRSLATVLDLHPHVNVLSDEIYDEISFLDERTPTLVTVAPHLRDRVFVTNGVSKSYAMTGWRLGYGVGDPVLVGAINKLQSQSSSCPSSISQYAAAEALTGDQSFVATSVASYRHRRDVMFELLAEIDGLTPVLPQGAFYLFVGCSDLIGSYTPDGTRLESDQDVVLYLLDHASVATIQGSAYGVDGYFRVSFATSEDVLRSAAENIAKAVAALTR